MFLTINLAGSIVQLFDVYLHKLVVTQIFPRLTVVAAHVFMIRLEANFFLNIIRKANHSRLPGYGLLEGQSRDSFIRPALNSPLSNLRRRKRFCTASSDAAIPLVTNL